MNPARQRLIDAREEARLHDLEYFEQNLLLPWATKLARRGHPDTETILTAVAHTSNYGLVERIRDPAIIAEYGITRILHVKPGWHPLEMAEYIATNFSATRAAKMLLEQLLGR